MTIIEWLGVVLLFASTYYYPKKDFKQFAAALGTLGCACFATVAAENHLLGVFVANIGLGILNVYNFNRSKQ